MKKIIILLAVVSTMFLSTGCHRQSELYNAAFTEYHFNNSENATSVKAVLGTINSAWEGDYAIKGLDTDVADAKANLKFAESCLAIELKSNKFKQYFQEGDYFVYTLKRVSNGEKLLVTAKFYWDFADDELDYEETFSVFND
jgi:hypothetical protein